MRRQPTFPCFRFSVSAALLAACGTQPSTTRTYPHSQVHTQGQQTQQTQGATAIAGGPEVAPGGDTDITEYTWDHRNRLVEITDRATEGGPATQVVQHTYDHENRWLTRTVDEDGDAPLGSTTTGPGSWARWRRIARARRSALRTQPSSCWPRRRSWRPRPWWRRTTTWRGSSSSRPRAPTSPRVRSATSTGTHPRSSTD